MARVNFGNGVTDIRGTIAGQVYSRNRGGAYTRAKVSPVQPITPFLANTRQAFKLVSQQYSGMLTQPERAAWAQFAATYKLINVFGNPIQANGIAMFQALNKRLQQLGFSTFADPPVTPNVLAPGAIAPVMSVNSTPTMSLLINPMVPTGGSPLTAYLWATRGLPPGRTPVKSDFRLVNDFSGTLRDDTYDWGAAYLTRFSPFVPADGEKIAIRYAYLDTNSGEISVVSDATILAAALPGPVIPLAFSKLHTNVATFSTSIPHGLSIGQTATVAGSTNDAALNGAWTVSSVLNATEFEASVTHADIPLAADGGTVQRTA